MKRAQAGARSAARLGLSAARERDQGLTCGPLNTLFWWRSRERPVRRAFLRPVDRVQRQGRPRDRGGRGKQVEPSSRKQNAMDNQSFREWAVRAAEWAADYRS